MGQTANIPEREPTTKGATLREGPLARARRLDAADPLADRRQRFLLPGDILYFAGNSLGPLPVRTQQEMRLVIDEQWGQALITSWNTADWFGLARRTGARIAPLIGADPEAVICCDSVSVNLYKALCAAIACQPGRRKIVTNCDEFPTDGYITSSVAEQAGLEVVAVPGDEVVAALDAAVAAVVVSHVDYRSARVLDLVAITAAAHRWGSSIVWDLSHTAGALACDVSGADIDFAVGCGYKYLNGGPGAPGYLYVAPRCLPEARQPLTGWFGHAAPFLFEPTYRPAPGSERFLTGTTPVLGMSALHSSLGEFADVDLDALWTKGRSLSELFVRLVDTDLTSRGFALVSPRDASQRGSHVGLRHPEGYPIMRALGDLGVIGDFRSPDLLRFGFAPLYNTHVEVVRLVAAIVEVIDSGAWRRPEYRRPLAVT